MAVAGTTTHPNPFRSVLFCFVLFRAGTAGFVPGPMRVDRSVLFVRSLPDPHAEDARPVLPRQQPFFPARAGNDRDAVEDVVPGGPVVEALAVFLLPEALRVEAPKVVDAEDPAAGGIDPQDHVLEPLVGQDRSRRGVPLQLVGKGDGRPADAGGDQDGAVAVYRFRHQFLDHHPDPRAGFLEVRVPEMEVFRSVRHHEDLGDRIEGDPPPLGGGRRGGPFLDVSPEL
mmetsp:Transcript_13621/g.31454  ORF Transcript_13621/g.31454 Transcript_13621/m.31454 type:complete len:228 (-) Transcript_13621:636-1319(-)